MFGTGRIDTMIVIINLLLVVLKSIYNYPHSLLTFSGLNTRFFSHDIFQNDENKENHSLRCMDAADVCNGYSVFGKNEFSFVFFTSKQDKSTHTIWHYLPSNLTAFKSQHTSLKMPNQLNRRDHLALLPFYFLFYKTPCSP